MRINILTKKHNAVDVVLIYYKATTYLLNIFSLVCLKYFYDLRLKRYY